MTLLSEHDSPHRAFLSLSEMFSCT